MNTGVAYHDVRSLPCARANLEDIVKHNCNFVVHTFSEADLAFYTRTMKEIVQVSKGLGLEVYVDPWAVGGIFGGEAFSRFVAENLDDRQVLANGRSVPAACMNSTAFRSFMKLWIETAADLGSDVVFWDEPHFFRVDWYTEGAAADEWACCCAACRTNFEERYGRPMPSDMDSDVIEYRQRTVVDFFSEMCAYAKKCGLNNMVCVLPEEDARRGVSSWDDLASIPSLDMFGTDPYWLFKGLAVEPYVRERTRKARTVCEKHQLELQMWVQAFLIPDGREDEVIQAADIMYEEGARNIAAWSYGGGGWTFARSENADKVWENLGRVFGRLHSRSA